jgi:hypothetical protein
MKRKKRDNLYVNKCQVLKLSIYVRRVWRYQREVIRIRIEEEQTTQRPKEKVQKDKQWSKVSIRINLKRNIHTLNSLNKYLSFQFYMHNVIISLYNISLNFIYWWKWFSANDVLSSPLLCTLQDQEKTIKLMNFAYLFPFIKEFTYLLSCSQEKNDAYYWFLSKVTHFTYSIEDRLTLHTCLPFQEEAINCKKKKVSRKMIKSWQ